MHFPNPFRNTKRIEQLESFRDNLKKEDLTATNIRNLGITGSYQEIGIFTEEGTMLNPQEIMTAARMAFNTFPRIAAGIYNVTNLTIAAGIEFKSEDEKLNEVINRRRVEIGLKNAEPEIVEQLAWAGTSYLKHRFENKLLSRIQVLGLPQSIYADIDQNSHIKQWIQRIILRGGEARPEGAKPWRLLRPGGGVFSLELGIAIPTRDLLQVKLGIDDWGLYGQGLLHAADDSIKMLRLIYRGIAVIAKYRPVDKSLIHVGKTGADGVWKSAAPQLYKQFRKALASTKDNEHYITNQDAKVQRLHGDDFNLTELINAAIQLEKAIASPMNMAFALFGDQQNYANAHAEEHVLGLMIERIRHALEVGTRPIYDRLLDESGALGTPYELVAIPFKTSFLQDPNDLGIKLFNGMIATRNEGRAVAGYDEVEESDEEEEIKDGDKFLDELRGPGQSNGGNGLFSLPTFGNGDTNNK